MKHFVTIKIAPMHPTVFREIAVLIAFQSNDNHRLGGDQSTVHGRTNQPFRNPL